MGVRGGGWGGVDFIGLVGQLVLISPVSLQ